MAAAIIYPWGSPSFQLSIPGVNFTSTSVVLLNGRECPTTYLGPNLLSVFVNTADLIPGGTCRVRNPAPTAELSEPIFFIRGSLNDGPVPMTSPTKVGAGSRAFTLSFSGMPVDKDTVIIWNGLAMPTTVNLALGYASTIIPEQEVAKPGYAVAALYSQSAGWITPAQIVNITLNQPVSGMVESPADGNLLAIVPDTTSVNPKSLIQIDPRSGQVTPLLALANNPSALVLASDKGSIYTGSTQSSLIRRLAWPSLAPLSTIDLVSGGTVSLAVVPGSPNSVMVGKSTSFPPTLEIVIYDDGTPRSLHGAVDGYRDCIAIDESGAKVYALNNGLTNFDMRAYTVDGSGLASSGRSGTLDIGFGTGLAISGGKLYTSSGLVIDSATLAPLSKRIVVPSDSRFLVDPPNNRIYFVGASGTYGTGYLFVYDLTTLNQVGALILHGMISTPQRLVRWGRNGLAVVPDSGYGNDSTMYVFQTDLVRPF
jgi:hypothetical protein